MIQFIQVGHSFGSKVLLDGFSWHIKPHSKIALLGPNGSGKTTLFRLAKGILTPDRGEVVRSKSTKISLFQQIPDYNPECTILETIFSEIESYSLYQKELGRLESKLEAISTEDPTFSVQMEKIDQWREENSRSGVSEIPLRAKKFLVGLGFRESDLERKVREFSPGYHHRLALAISLLEPHNLLLLDEPTNHLDDSAKQWLADYLKNTQNSFVLVTHDPDFLENTSKIIAEIHPKGVFTFEGNLDEFFALKESIHEKMLNQYKKEEAYLKSREEWIERFRSKATKARQVQSAIKKLEKRDSIQKPSDSVWNQSKDYEFQFSSSGKMILKVEDGKFSRGNQVILDRVNFTLQLGDKVAIVGPNGAGKTTFLNLISSNINWDKGNIQMGPNTKWDIFHQTQKQDLPPGKNLMETVQSHYPLLNETQTRSLLGFFGFSGDSVFKSNQLLSGGEQSRLRLLLLVPNPTNLLMLDEPTNHLDLIVRQSLISALQAYQGALLIVSHDPEFLSQICNKTWEIQNGRITDLNLSAKEWESTKSISIKISKHNPTMFPTKDTQFDHNTSKSQKNKKKTLSQKLEQIEKDLIELENQKKTWEEKLSNPDPEELQKIMDQYNLSLSHLKRKEEEWESISLELETIASKE